MRKGTKLYSIFRLKCPRCQVGDLFCKPGFLVFTNILDMPDKCPNCRQNFKQEPGYYTSALWISYPIVLIIFIPLIILGFSLDSLHSFFKYIYPLVIIAAFILQIPLMRIARAILLNMTIDYTSKW